MSRFLTRAFALAATILIGDATAQIIPVSGNALVSVAGQATVPTIYGGQTDSYSTVHSTPVPYAQFTNAVSGDAFAEITILPPFELLLGTTLHATSNASLTSAITANAITVNSSVAASADAYSQVGTRGASARSLVDITFRLDEAASFSFSGSATHSQNSAYMPSVFTTSLTTSGGSEVFQFTHADNGLISPSVYHIDLAAPLTGILSPGIYQFKMDLNAVAGPDPLGDSGSGSTSFTLRMTSVPEGGTTAVLVLSALPALFMIRRTARRIG
jgi:hypothetical protein